MIYVVVACLATPLVFLTVLRMLCFPKQSKHLVDLFLKRRGNGRGLIAHRGGKPENTLVAITKSHDLGAIGVEVDLAFTKDGQPVLIHDTTIDRTSNGIGRVNRMTLAQLKALDFGSKTGNADSAGERIPTLFEAVELCKKLDMLMLLELKESPAKSAELISSLFSEDPSLYSRIAVISFFPNILYKIRQVNPRVLVGLVTRVNVLSTKPNGAPRSETWWKNRAAAVLDKVLSLFLTTWFWRLLGVSLLLANKNDILSGRVDLVKWDSRGILVLPWTVNSKRDKNYFQDVLKLPFITDDVDTNSSAPEQS